MSLECDSGYQGNDAAGVSRSPVRTAVCQFVKKLTEKAAMKFNLVHELHVTHRKGSDSWFFDIYVRRWLLHCQRIE
jgi:hypothetical protein